MNRLLGIPLSGQTLLFNYFAVMLAAEVRGHGLGAETVRDREGKGEGERVWWEKGSGR